MATHRRPREAGTAYPVPGLVRAARRKADLSQLDLARALNISQSTIARLEAGHRRPSLDLFDDLMGATGHLLVVVNDIGELLLPMRDREDLRDGAGRRYPSHLDTIVDPRPGDWWADAYGLAAPPETFKRDRAERDARRKVSQWEVRAAQHRRVPPPPGAYA